MKLHVVRYLIKRKVNKKCYYYQKKFIFWIVLFLSRTKRLEILF